MRSFTIKFSAIFALLICFSAMLFSCGNNNKELLCAHPWETISGIYVFTESGKICYNFESEEESVSYYKLLSGNRINMYTEEGEDMGMIFDYHFSDGKLYIGKAEYKKAEIFSSEPEEN